MTRAVSGGESGTPPECYKAISLKVNKATTCRSRTLIRSEMTSRMLTFRIDECRWNCIGSPCSIKS